MKFNLRELKKFKRQNQKERIEFIELYTKWLMKTPNKLWSKEHTKFINSGIKSAKTAQKSKT